MKMMMIACKLVWHMEIFPYIYFMSMVDTKLNGVFWTLQHEIIDAQCMATKAYKQYVNGPRIQEGLKDAMMQS